MKTALTSLLLAGGIAFTAAPAAAQSAAPESRPPAIERNQGRDAPGDMLPVEPRDAPDVERSDPAASDDERLDRLFERLAKAEDKRRADRIANNIQRRMLRSGSPTIDLLMAQSKKAVDAKQLGVSLDILDAVVRLKPDYAEGWNRRATVYFMREDFGAALADIERVLQLEPRHWGALSGLAMILIQIERNEEAVAAIDAALSVHPHLDSLKEQRERAAAKYGGSDI